MKSSSIRGTPINSIKAPNNQGMNHGSKPKGMSGTVNRQFEGDQKINREEGISTGTPYQSQDGNGPETLRVRSSGKYGMVIGESGDNQNPADNGNGVILDGITREDGYLARKHQTLDSPVPERAPRFNTRTVMEENLAHLGEGTTTHDQVEDRLLAIDGVMSRGIDNTEDDIREERDEQTKPFGFKRTAEDQQQVDDDRG